MNIEKRVLRVKEIPEWDGGLFIEHRGVDYIEPAVYRYTQDLFYRFAGKDHAWGIDLTIGSYGDDWRAWTLRPTEEERKETEWR